MSEVGQGELLPAEVAQATPDGAGTAIAPEAPVSGEQQPEAPKTFTQEELDAIVAKRIAKEQRKAQREADRRIAEALQQRPPEQPEAPADRPKPEAFKTTEEYVEAVAEWKTGQVIKKLETERQQKEAERRQVESAQALEATWQESVSKAEEKYDDFAQVTNNPQLPISPVMAQAIKASSVGAEVAYFLGKNPDEAARIARLPAFLAVKEMGKLEAKVEAAPPEAPKKPSAAPAPIKPINGKVGAGSAPETTDPKSLDWYQKQYGDRGTSMWINADRDRQRRKLEAQGRR